MQKAQPKEVGGVEVHHVEVCGLVEVSSGHIITSSRGWGDLDGLWQYQRKKKVSERINYFSQRKLNVPPAACGDAGWRIMVLTFIGDKWELWR